MHTFAFFAQKCICSRVRNTYGKRECAHNLRCLKEKSSFRLRTCSIDTSLLRRYDVCTFTHLPFGHKVGMWWAHQQWQCSVFYRWHRSERRFSVLQWEGNIMCQREVWLSTIWLSLRHCRAMVCAIARARTALKSFIHAPNGGFLVGAHEYNTRTIYH